MEWILLKFFDYVVAPIALILPLVYAILYLKGYFNPGPIEDEDKAIIADKLREMEEFNRRREEHQKKGQK